MMKGINKAVDRWYPWVYQTAEVKLQLNRSTSFYNAMADGHYLIFIKVKIITFYFYISFSNNDR